MKGLADLLKKWLNEESCVDKNYDELQKKEDTRIYTMSETYESYTADDYKKQGDIGPYFEVVPLHDYLALRTKLTELDELNTQTCVQRDIASERVDELKAKLEVAVEALEFYAMTSPHEEAQGRLQNIAWRALYKIEEE